MGGSDVHKNACGGYAHIAVRRANLNTIHAQDAPNAYANAGGRSTKRIGRKGFACFVAPPPLRGSAFARNTELQNGDTSANGEALPPAQPVGGLRRGFSARIPLTNAEKGVIL